MLRPRIDILLLRTVIINSITAAVAVGVLLNRWRNPQLTPYAWPNDEDAPLVDIIIPARDEERNIAPLIQSLMLQRYPVGRWRVTVVNDHSTDSTRQLIDVLASRHTNLRLVDAPELPSGWTGKNHAMYTAARSASQNADYLLFVDADTRHDPLMLATVVSRAESTRADLLSLIIHVDMESFWERLLVPEVGELYTLLVGTMDSVNRQGSTSGAAANGQFMLMRPDAYAGVISLPEIRLDVAEDRAIAAALKAQGRIVRLEYGEQLVHARVYESLSEMWLGYSKTMFWASGHNLPRALAVALALFFYAFAPLLTLSGVLFKRESREKKHSLLHAIAQILPMTILRAAINKRLGVPMQYAGAYPLAVLVGDAILLFSLYRVVSGKGVSWKGRTYK